MRRALLVIGGGLGALVLAAAGLAALLLATAPGHAFVRKMGLQALNGAIDGTARAGEITGALWRAADVRDLVVDDTSGTMVLRVARLRAGYGLIDLLRGRIVLHSLELVRPVVVLDQRPDGTWNFQHVLRLLDSSTAPGGLRPLVDLRNVRITDGTVVVRRRTTPDSQETLRLVGVSLDLSRLRASHPDSTAIVASVRRVAARLVDPAFEIVRADGWVAVDGDSVRFDFDHFALPASDAAVAGRVHWGGPHVRADIALNASRLTFADLRGLVPDLPAAGGGSIAVHVMQLADGGAVVDVRQAALASGRSRVQGTASVARGPRGGVRIRASDVTFAPLDLAVLRPYVDSLPRGLVTGRVRASGALDALAVTATAAFVDEGVAGRPRSTIAATGGVGVGGADGLRLHGLRVTSLDLAAATARHHVAVLPAAGRFGLTGRLEGPWRALRLDSGTVSYADSAGRRSVLRGSLVLGLGDTLRLDADMRADSLRLAQVAAFVPGAVLTGWAVGPISLHGPLSAMDYDLALAGPWGALAGRGQFGLGDSAIVLRGAGTVDSLDVHRGLAAAPVTRASGRWEMNLRVPTDTAVAPIGAVAIRLGLTTVAGVPFDSAGLRASFEARRLLIDSAWIDRPDFAATAVGAIGWSGEGQGQLSWWVRADTLAVFAPLVRWARAASGDTTAPDSITIPQGALVANGRVVGTTAVWRLDGTLESALLHYGDQGARRLQVRGRLDRRAVGWGFDARLTADSVWAAGLRYSRVSGTAAGATDTFAVRVEANFAQGSSVRTRLRVERDSALVVAVDSLDLRLAGELWRLRRPARIEVGDTLIAVDSLDLRGEGGGRLRAAGSLPRRGSGAFEIVADSVPIAHLFALAERDTTGVGGVVDLGVRVEGPADAPIMDVSVVVADGRYGDYQTPALRALGRYVDHRLTFKGGLYRDTTKVMSVGAALPLDLSLASVAERRLPGELRLTARTDSVALVLFAPMSGSVRDLSGYVAADVAVSGTWEHQNLRGFVDVVNGAVTVPSIRARYTGIGAHVTFADSVISVERLVARSDGSLSLTGTVTLRTSAAPLLDLRARVSGFTALDIRSFAGATTSGDLVLRGTPLGAHLSGSVVVDAGYLRFADLVEKRVVNLDDPEFRAIVDSNLAAANLAPDIQTVFLDRLLIDDLHVEMGSDVWLRSTEANIQLGGDFQVSKSIEDGTPRYRLDGALNANRGTYRLVLPPVSKEFRVTRGAVRFYGTTDFDPEMDIVAEHTVRTVDGGELVVRALIGGTLMLPRLRLESDRRPALTETEIVSYLMFGRPSFELAGTQGASSQQRLLASALVSFAGVAAGQLEQTLVSQLGLPLDYLTIRPGSGSSESDLLTGARIEAGTQLSNRVFLSLNAGLCEVRQGQGQAWQRLGVGLEYRFSRQWTLETSYEPIVQGCRPSGSTLEGAGRQFGIDLFWQMGNR